MNKRFGVDAVIVLLRNHKVQSIIFIVSQLLCIFGIFGVSLSQRWLTQECAKSQFENCEAQLGIYDSCVVYTDYYTNENRGPDDHFYCRRCKSSPHDDKAYTKETDTDLLTTSKVFAGLSMAVSVILLISAGLYIMCAWIDILEVVQKITFITTLICCIAQLFFFTIQIGCASHFFKNVEHIMVDGRKYNLEGLNFGWPRVVCWFVWLLAFVPTGIIMHLFCKLVRVAT